MNHSWNVIVIESQFSHNADGDICLLQLAYHKANIFRSHLAR